MRSGRVLFCVFLIAVAGFAIYTARGWAFKAALFPLAVSIPLLILASVQLLQIIFDRSESVDVSAVDLEFTRDLPPELARRRVIDTFSWIIGFIASVYLVGFPLTVPIFIFCYLKFQSDVGWLAALVATAITWGGFYALFQWLVHIQFEPGAVQTWLAI
jgi:hypothetical protein